MTRWNEVGLFLAVAASLCGCMGRKDKWQLGRPPVVKASGEVLHNGAPLADAVLTFHPVDGSHGAFARSDARGRFSLTTFDPEDGAVAGEYKVTVAKMVIEYEPDPLNPEVAPPLYHAEQSMVPDEFGSPETTSLVVVIPESGTSAIQLDVTGREGKLKVLADRRKK